MITFTVRFDDAGISAEFRKAASVLIRQVALSIEDEMKALMALPKHGRTYNRKGRIHVASAPGEPPAIDTGNLVGSIKTNIISETEAQIIIPPEYAEALEFGGKNAPRPFVKPAISNVLDRFRQGGILASARE